MFQSARTRTRQQSTTRRRHWRSSTRRARAATCRAPSPSATSGRPTASWSSTAPRTATASRRCRRSSVSSTTSGARATSRASSSPTRPTCSISGAWRRPRESGRPPSSRAPSSRRRRRTAATTSPRRSTNCTARWSAGSCSRGSRAGAVPRSRWSRCWTRCSRSRTRRSDGRDSSMFTWRGHVMLWYSTPPETTPRAPITVIIIWRLISDGATKLQQNSGTTRTRSTGAGSRCLARSGTISRRCYRGRTGDNAEVRGFDGACSCCSHVSGTCSVGDTGLATTSVIWHLPVCSPERCNGVLQTVTVKLWKDKSVPMCRTEIDVNSLCRWHKLSTSPAWRESQRPRRGSPHITRLETQCVFVNS